MHREFVMDMYAQISSSCMPRLCGPETSVVSFRSLIHDTFGRYLSQPRRSLLAHLSARNAIVCFAAYLHTESDREWIQVAREQQLEISRFLCRGWSARCEKGKRVHSNGDSEGERHGHRVRVKLWWEEERCSELNYKRVKTPFQIQISGASF